MKKIFDMFRRSSEKDMGLIKLTSEQEILKKLNAAEVKINELTIALNQMVKFQGDIQEILVGVTTALEEMIHTFDKNSILVNIDPEEIFNMQNRGHDEHSHGDMDELSMIGSSPMTDADRKKLLN